MSRKLKKLLVRISIAAVLFLAGMLLPLPVYGEFETNIIAPTATYGIAFGNVQRSTHNNTSWDGAQFEVNAQKYADCSEQDYGAALISDCKYGYSIKDITTKVQEKVKAAIENMTGLEVADVNIRVAGVDVPEED